VAEISQTVVWSGVVALVSQVTVLVHVKAVLLGGAAVEALQTHLYRCIAARLYAVVYHNS